MATAILDHGLGDYYRLRERPAYARDSAAAEEDPESYDDPQFQRGFVREHPDHSEAFLLLEGVRCAACVWLNEQVISRLPGVLAVDVNYATQRARICWDPRRVRLSSILGAIRRIGYRAHPYKPDRVETAHRRERRQSLWRLFVAAFGMMQVMMYAFPAYLAGPNEMSWDIARMFQWAGLILTLPVLVYAAGPFFRGAIRDLGEGRLGMDLPVSLGIAIAFGASAAATFTGIGDVYYDSIAMFVFLLLLGRHLELIVRQRASGALRHLERLIPDMAERLKNFPNSFETERIPTDAMRPGDFALIKAGQHVPADGVIEWGEGSIDESLISGEAKPVSRRPGDTLIAGAINLSNPLVMRVSSTGVDTVVSGIVRLVEQAAGEKRRVTVLSEKGAGMFVLLVLALAATAASYWLSVDPDRAVWVAISVLVATCPCAFTLAGPVAVTAATGELARRGLAITRGHALESLARATDIVVDKTGTLTLGELRLLDILPTGPLTSGRCLQLAAAIEAGAMHPIANAITRAARETNISVLPAEGVVNQSGQGIEGSVDGQQVRIGTNEFVLRDDFHKGPFGDSRGSRDDSCVVLGDPSGILAVLRFGDETRPDAASAIARLRRLGLKVHLVSGDADEPVRNLGTLLGIEHCISRARPQDKQAYVQSLQEAGAVVVMAGDGMNDAPVMAQADVSIAMAGGAHLAQIHADALLVSGRIGDLVRGIEMARKTRDIVRQNVAWAIAYNFAVMPLAFSGTIPPWLAAIGMSVSSLAVVLNALRLVHRPAAVRSAIRIESRFAAV